MATLLIRSLKESVKESIRIRAARHGRSMEAEARAMLEAGLEADRPEEHLYLGVRRAVEKFGSASLDLPRRELGPDPPSFT